MYKYKLSMRKSLLIIILYFFAIIQLFAQRKNPLPPQLDIVNPFDIPPYDDLAKTPLFFQYMMEIPLNIEKVDSAFTNFGKTEELYRDAVNDLHEDPFERFFIHWRMKINQYLDNNKQFVVPNYQPLKTIKTTNKQSRVQASRAWQPLGPMSAYSGKGASQTLIPQHQNIYYIGVSPSNTNILYANTETGWTFKSTDKGLNWTSLDELGAGTGPIAIHPTNQNITFIMKGNNLYKTLDGGVSWVLSKVFTSGAERIVFAPNSPNTILIASNESIIRSTDTGNTWVNVLSGSFTDVEIQPNNPSVVYAAGYNGTFYKSTDGGISFTNKSFFTGTGAGTLLTVSQANVNVVYFATLFSGFTHLYRSDDAGNSFTLTNNTGLTSGQGFYDFILMANPLNADQVILGTQSMVKSLDKGVTYSALGGYTGPFNIHPDAQDIFCVNGETFMATDGGITYSTDFYTSLSNYNTRMNGIWANDFWGFGHAWNYDIFGGGRYHNGDVIYNGKWGENKGFAICGGEAATGTFIDGKKGMTYRDCSGGAIYVPSDNILNGVNVTNDVVSLAPNDYYYGDRLGDTRIHTVYENIYFVAKNNAVYYSWDYGKTFTALKDFGSTTWQIHVSRSNPKKVFVLTANSLYYTNDIFAWEFATWNKVNLPITDPLSVQLDETDENTLWLANRKNWYNSTNIGTNWFQESLPSNFTNIQGIVKQEGKKNAIYVIGADATTGYMKIAYKDNDTPITDYSTGLVNYGPNRIKPFAFYAQNKLRFGGGAIWGVWQNDFYSNTYSVIAQPTTNAYPSICIGDTVRCESRSVVNQSNVSWNWSFSSPPNYINSSTIRNPKIVFNTRKKVTATLTVTDNVSGLSDSKSTTFSIEDTQTAAPIIISSLEDLNGFNFVKGRNVVLKADVPSTATLFVYYSDTFTANQLINVTGNIVVKKVPLASMCK